MTFRNDISVDWTVSPRIITVAAPSTELTIQDLHDTLRVLEERPSEGLPYPQIIDSAGKEPLGGGVSVGITATLIDAKISFEARKASIVEGYVTTPDATGRTLNDEYASFITAGAEIGAWLYNMTDGSVCTVLGIASETQLITDYLGDGYDDRFDLNDVYEIRNIIQCEVSGGNLVAIDNDGYETNSILPTAGTQIVRTASSSATLQELEAIQYSSFGGGVTVDTSSSSSGTDFPVGTKEYPVNNFQDAVSIATNRGFNKLFINGTATLTAGDNVENFILEGPHTIYSSLIVEAGALTKNATFTKLTISGTLDGTAVLINCRIYDLNNIEGFIEDSLLNGTITLSGSAATTIIGCIDDISGPGVPTINMGSSTGNFILRTYSGGIKITNITSSRELSLDIIAGRIILDSSIVMGDILVKGVGLLENNAGPAVSVDYTGLVNPALVTDEILNRMLSGHSQSGSVGESLNKIEKIRQLSQLIMSLTI